MKNMIKLYSLKIDLEKFLNLTNDSKFESYKKYDVYANKDIKVNTFYLLDKVDGNQMFYLDQKNNLKRMKINIKPEDLNSQEYFILDKIKSNNGYQISLNESKLKLIKSNNLFSGKYLKINRKKQTQDIANKYHVMTFLICFINTPE